LIKSSFSEEISECLNASEISVSNLESEDLDIGIASIVFDVNGVPIEVN